MENGEKENYHSMVQRFLDFNKNLRAYVDYVASTLSEPIKEIVYKYYIDLQMPSEIRVIKAPKIKSATYKEFHGFDDLIMTVKDPLLNESGGFQYHGCIQPHVVKAPSVKSCIYPEIHMNEYELPDSEGRKMYNWCCGTALMVFEKPMDGIVEFKKEE